jgi:lysophospholipase L1-like esterase
MRENRMKKYVLSILPLILIFILLEAGARVCHTIVNDIREYKKSSQNKDQWWQHSSDIGWERLPNFSGIILNSDRSFDNDGYFTIDSYQVKDKTTPKILLVGDSRTFGHGVEVTKTFGEILENILPGYYVINLGVPGYSSYQGIKILEKYIGTIKPSIVIVSFSFNDRRYVVDQKNIDSSEYFTRVYRLNKANYIKERLRNVSYVFRSMQYVYNAAMKAFSDTDTKPEYFLNTVYPRVSPQDYRANLIKMIEITQQQNAKMMLLYLGDNPDWTAFLHEGSKLLKQGKIEEAVIKLKECKHWAFSILAQKYLACAFEQQKNFAELEKVRHIKPFISLHGGHPLFLDSDYGAIMEKVSSDYNVPLIEGGAELLEHPEYYMDGSHFDEHGHLIVAKAIAKVINESKKATISP